MQNTDWDIYRYIIAVVDCGSAVAAADRLGVNASTVLRKVAKFESDNGILLFEKLQSGYRPTPECNAVIQAARQIEHNVAAINRDLLGRDLRLEGPVRVTTTDSFLVSVLSPLVRNFIERHPRIQIDISVTNTRLNLTRLDADIAIRASRKPPDSLIGQRVSGLAFAVYGADKQVRCQPAEESRKLLQTGRWVGAGEALAGSPVVKWMERNVDPDKIVVSADTFVAMCACARDGVGFAMLPCFLGDTTPGITRINDPIQETDTSVWVLTHSDIRGAARVKAFNEYIAKEMRAISHILEGSGP